MKQAADVRARVRESPYLASVVEDTEVQPRSPSRAGLAVAVSAVAVLVVVAGGLLVRAHIQAEDDANAAARGSLTADP
jgi:hypothetical protein